MNVLCVCVLLPHTWCRIQHQRIGLIGLLDDVVKGCVQCVPGGAGDPA